MFRATPTRKETVERSSFTNDAAAPDQLQILSLPARTSLANNKGAVYDSSSGSGINIYVIDSGLTPSSPVGRISVLIHAVTDNTLAIFVQASVLAV